MAVDDVFQIAGKVSIERHRGTMRFGQRDRFGEQPSRLRSGGAHRHHDRFLALNDDLGTGAHARQHVRKVAGRFRFRDVDHPLGHNEIIQALRPIAIAAIREPPGGNPVHARSHEMSRLEPVGELANYYLAHSARADMYRRLGRTGEARASYEKAPALTQQEPEQQFLQEQIRQLK
jgi:hypothetical protein